MYTGIVSDNVKEGSWYSLNPSRPGLFVDKEVLERASTCNFILASPQKIIVGGAVGAFQGSESQKFQKCSISFAPEVLAPPVVRMFYEFSCIQKIRSRAKTNESLTQIQVRKCRKKRCEVRR